MKREYDLHYLNQEYSAMRWLAKQGLTPLEIQNMTWGAVDETTKTIRLAQKTFFIRYDKETRVSNRIEDKKELYIPIRGSGHEWFFLESKFKCPWMFTAYNPTTWRKQGSKKARFPVSQIEKICKDIRLSDSRSILTNIERFANIEISKLNITNSKPNGLIREAEVVKS